MTTPGEQRNEQPSFVRAYVITDGRALPDNNLFDLITLVKAVKRWQPEQIDPEKRNLLELCSGGYLSVAEIGAHLGLPLGIIKVLLSDLLAEGRVSRAPASRGRTVDKELLQEVLDGLKAYFG